MSALGPALEAIVRELAREEARKLLQEAQAPGARPEGYLTTSEAARRAGVAQDTVLAWIGKGLLPATKPQGVKGWKVRPADLEDFLKGSTGAPPLRLEDHRAARAAALAAAALKGVR